MSLFPCLSVDDLRRQYRPAEIGRAPSHAVHILTATSQGYDRPHATGNSTGGCNSLLPADLAMKCFSEHAPWPTGPTAHGDDGKET